MKLSAKGNDIQREMSIETLLISRSPPTIPWRGHKFIYTSVRGFVSTCQRSRHGAFINSDLTLRDHQSTAFNPALYTGISSLVQPSQSTSRLYCTNKNHYQLQIYLYLYQKELLTSTNMEASLERDPHWPHAAASPLTYPSTLPSTPHQP